MQCDRGDMRSLMRGSRHVLPFRQAELTGAVTQQSTAKCAIVPHMSTSVTC